MNCMIAYRKITLLHALVSSAAVVSLLLTGCADPVEQEPAAAPSPKPGVEPEEKQAPVKPKHVDDPLIGSWKVIDAKGAYAAGNIGVVWTFEAGGTAKSAGFSDPPSMGRHDGPVGVNAVRTESLWSWRRVSNDKIEMAPKGAAGAGEISHSFDGDKLVLDWNRGGQILHLVKQ